MYESEDCSSCPFQRECTKAKTGSPRKLYINRNWEDQKKTIRQLLSDEKTGELYGQRKVDAEPVFGNLKANLGFTRLSVRGDARARNELGFAFLALNIRKYTARSPK
ncbi:hypothetical protein DH09_00175 (plasmid) [Bacillaceae bacterium JMAK1]|nr:hypothetical protein DH09_00175 [Bacillaceae bacterium JMAK1]